MAWLALLRGLREAPALEQIREVNRFVNQWPYRADGDNYGRSDYWATPLEFFRRSTHRLDDELLSNHMFRVLCEAGSKAPRLVNIVA